MYSELCDSYLEKGISVIPSRGKKVVVPNFGQYSSRLPTKGELNFFKVRYGNNNIGVMMGRINNLMVIDIDTDKKDVLDMVYSICPETPCMKFGKKGMSLFYKMSRKTNDMYISKDNGCMLEFLCTSKYTIIPPSTHPLTKKPYIWIKKDLLSTIDSLPNIKEESLLEVGEYMKAKHDCITLAQFRASRGNN